MARGLLALASAATIALALLACSADDAGAGKTTPIVDGGRTRDANGPVESQDDGGTPPPVSDAGDDGALTFCPAPAPTVYPPWVAPETTVQPCFPADFALYQQNQAKSFDEQKAAMAAQNATCAVCIFSKESDTHWGPVVKTNDGRIFFSYGICYTRAGGSDACGKADQKAEWCRQKVCNVCLTGSNMQDCLSDSRTGACGGLPEEVIAACSPLPSSVRNHIDAVCHSNADVVKTICGG